MGQRPIGQLESHHPAARDCRDLGRYPVQTTHGADVHGFPPVVGEHSRGPTAINGHQSFNEEPTFPTLQSSPRRLQAGRSGLGRRSAAETPPTAVSAASRQKQIPSSAPQGHGLGKTLKKQTGDQFHKSLSDLGGSRAENREFRYHLYARQSRN